jgi:hypothetical protein
MTEPVGGGVVPEAAPAAGENPNPHYPERKATKPAENRADFIRRLFAVTVSVGFANQLIAMHWVQDRKWPPEATEIPHIIFLLLGLWLVIQSWEGYFSALQSRPLERPLRFYVDVAIVLAYLVLLTASTAAAPFLTFICFIFVLYLLWDFLTFREYSEDYDALNNRLTTFVGGVLGAVFSRSAFRHELCTLVALAYFIVLYFVYRRSPPSTSADYVIAAAILLGLIVYRWAQNKRPLLIIIILPLVFAILVLIFGRNGAQRL